jgi:predicted Zn-ribbon and HTH transcriptional regulator
MNKKRKEEAAALKAYKFHCERCEWDWNPRPDRVTETPRTCPRCKSYKWDVPRGL